MRKPGWYWVRQRYGSYVSIQFWDAENRTWNGSLWHDDNFDFIADEPLEQPDMPAREQQ